MVIRMIHDHVSFMMIRNYLFSSTDDALLFSVTLLMYSLLFIVCFNPNPNAVGLTRLA